MNTNADIGNFVHDNAYSSNHPQPISVYLNGPSGQTVHGSDAAETLHLEYLSAPATVDGGGGDDIIIGGPGNDTLTGGGGNDTIRGGAGADTAVYTGTLTAASITSVVDGDPTTVGNQPGWQVSAGGAEGTDLLTGVERITDGAGHNFLFVGHGGYATIQAAVDAAVNGDTILIAAGTYREQVSISGKDISLQGAGIGQTIIELPTRRRWSRATTRATAVCPTATRW